MIQFWVTSTLLTYALGPDLASAIRCYKCGQIDDRGSCQNSVTCKSTEVCFNKKILTNGNVTYTMGCEDKDLCSLLKTSSSLIGRRDDGNGDCLQCCYHDNCNANLCSRNSTSTETRTSVSTTTTTTLMPIWCVDKIDNCKNYGAQACDYQYRQWAIENCMRTCHICRTSEPTTTLMPIRCADKIDNCKDYGAQACIDQQYRQWAIEHCMGTCQICESWPHPRGECKDYRYNCAAYGPKVCTGIYKDWGSYTCPLTCGYCQPCGDKLDNCDVYGKSLCHDKYRLWAEDNCASFCGYCPTTNTHKTTNPTSTTSTAAQHSTLDACKDKLNNCKHFGKDACSIHPPWSRVNCASFCGMCRNGILSETPCVDKYDSCFAYGKDVCYGTYEAWARINCASFCGYCQTNNAQTTTNPVTTTVAPAVQKSSCLYKGHYYGTGDTWTHTEGCVWNCTCVDGSINWFHCKDRCPPFKDLPATCIVYKKPGQCCSAVDCGGKDIQEATTTSY